jgi:hypothetical protein
LTGLRIGNTRIVRDHGTRRPDIRSGGKQGKKDSGSDQGHDG